MTMPDCLFCKIIRGEIPAKKIFENAHVLGFEDIHPQAKMHHIFIHKHHTKNVNEMAENGGEVAEIFRAIQEFTRTHSIEEHGFRVVTNVGKVGGQTVFHTHFHLLGGEPLGPFGKYKAL